MPSFQPVALWLRLAALLYDLFPLLGLWLLVAALFLAAAHGAVDVAHPPWLYQFALRGALLAVTAAYFVVSWARGGQTIGMRAWRIRVVAADGTGLTWSRALLRFAAALLSLAAAGLGFAWCLIDRERRAWHDLAAGSRLGRIEGR
ncbi:MAG: RDD family protein [Dokdonella sp.]|uniref:RDD family protein n=1 Tax=Dokdonella sp. TaxID=2291710 RepID=UPI0025B8B3FF|nr:RDD family protein [Dokdonella sp.]MBX3701157.1 RDD family protein [Dokdonella sp.]MCW5578663.1 RDD family protein [Dokdonella sp.]